MNSNKLFSFSHSTIGDHIINGNCQPSSAPMSKKARLMSAKCVVCYQVIGPFTNYKGHLFVHFEEV